MKKQKIVVNTPKESTMDFAGTPGRVIRYDTKTRNGDKTIVDFIVLNASRDRFIIVTLWGSAEEREGNEADLAAIMASLKIPADTGSFWSGNSAAKPSTGDKASGETVPDPARPGQPPPKRPQAAAPKGPAVPDTSDERIGAYMSGLMIQNAIERCDMSTTSRQREAIERKWRRCRRDGSRSRRSLRRRFKSS